MKMPVKGQLYLNLFVFLFILCFSEVLVVQAAEPTTAVRVVKYAADKKTVAAEKNVDYRWMEANLPVQGDGKTHYYHQGPVFEGDKWDPDRVKNLKDKGAVKGTSLMDLCALVGGMSPGDEVVISAPDGFYVKFGYQNIYEPSDRQGPIVVCWYNGEDVDAGERQGEGYVPDYFTGMRLVFMSKVPNAEGKYVFGNIDMKECLADEKYWYYYENQYPSTNGFSVKWVEEIAIYPGGAPDQPVKSAHEKTGRPETSPPQFSTFTILLLIVCGLIIIATGINFLKRK